MGIVPFADGVRTTASAPLHVRSRAFGPGPNPFRPRYAPRVSTAEHASFGAGALRALAERHGIRPKRSLGQHFLIDPNLARAIAADAGVGPGDRVVEIGAGLGSLTRALAEAGAEVLAVEVDPSLISALEESVSGLDRVRVLHTDATDPEWQDALDGDGWVLAANLPYNVATHLVLDTLRDVPRVGRLVVMVQREVGERLVAGAGRARLRDPERPCRLPGRGHPRAPRASVGLLAAPEGGVRDRAARAPGRTGGCGRRAPALGGGGCRVRRAAEDDAERPPTARPGGRGRRTSCWEPPGSIPRPGERRSRSRSSRGSQGPSPTGRRHRDDRVPDAGAGDACAREDQRVPARARPSGGRLPRHRDAAAADLARRPCAGGAGRGTLRVHRRIRRRGAASGTTRTWRCGRRGRSPPRPAARSRWARASRSTSGSPSPPASAVGRPMRRRRCCCSTSCGRRASAATASPVSPRRSDPTFPPCSSGSPRTRTDAASVWRRSSCSRRRGS